MLAVSACFAAHPTDEQPLCSPASSANLAIDLAKMESQPRPELPDDSDSLLGGTVDIGRDTPEEEVIQDGVMPNQETAIGRTIPRSTREQAAPGGVAPWYRSPYVSLSAIIIVIFALSRLFKRYVPAVRTPASRAISVIGRTTISAKQSVVLLHVGRRVVLLSVSPDSMRLITDFTDPQDVAILLGKSAVEPITESKKFDAKLAHELGKYEDVGDQSDAVADRTKGQLQTLIGRLRQLQNVGNQVL